MSHPASSQPDLRGDLDLGVLRTRSFSPHTYFIHVFLSLLSLCTPYKYLMSCFMRGNVTLENSSLSSLLDVIHGSFRFDS